MLPLYQTDIYYQAETTLAGLCVLCCYHGALRVKYMHYNSQFDVIFHSHMWSSQTMEQTTRLKKPLTSKQVLCLPFSRNILGFDLMYLSHYHKLDLRPNTGATYQLCMDPTTGIVEAFPFKAIKTLSACCCTLCPNSYCSRRLRRQNNGTCEDNGLEDHPHLVLKSWIWSWTEAASSAQTHPTAKCLMLWRWLWWHSMFGTHRIIEL